jgi:hypothetical protein
MTMGLSADRAINLPCGPEQRTILKWLAGPLGIEPIGAALLRAS